MKRFVNWLEKYGCKGGLFPTFFDVTEIWGLNSSRCGGKFNLLFFWLYPVTIILIPFTLLCLAESVFTYIFENKTVSESK